MKDKLVTCSDLHFIGGKKKERERDSMLLLLLLTSSSWCHLGGESAL